MTNKIAIEIYIVILCINSMVGVGQYIYKSTFISSDLRSPINQQPLGSITPTPDAARLIENMTAPVNGTSGAVVPWVEQGLQNFLSIITVVLDFLSFFTGGFVVSVLNSFGLPSYFVTALYAPVLIYIAYMFVSFITNRQ